MLRNHTYTYTYTYTHTYIKMCMFEDERNEYQIKLNEYYDELKIQHQKQDEKYSFISIIFTNSFYRSNEFKIHTEKRNGYH